MCFVSCAAVVCGAVMGAVLLWPTSPPAAGVVRCALLSYGHGHIWANSPAEWGAEMGGWARVCQWFSMSGWASMSRGAGRGTDEPG